MLLQPCYGSHSRGNAAAALGGGGHILDLDGRELEQLPHAPLLLLGRRLPLAPQYPLPVPLHAGRCGRQAGGGAECARRGGALDDGGGDQVDGGERLGGGGGGARVDGGVRHRGGGGGPGMDGEDGADGALAPAEVLDVAQMGAAGATAVARGGGGVGVVLAFTGVESGVSLATGFGGSTGR